MFDLLIEPRVKEKENTHTHTHTNGQTLVGPKNNGCARGAQHVEPTREVGGRRKNSGRAAPSAVGLVAGSTTRPFFPPDRSFLLVDEGTFLDKTSSLGHDMPDRDSRLRL